MVLLLSVTISSVINGDIALNADHIQEVRTVLYQDDSTLNDVLNNEFDESEMTLTEDGVEVVARKTFDMSILDEYDLVGLDETEDSFTVRYKFEYVDEESTLLMTVIIEGQDEVPLIETLPGLVTYNASGEADVMFVTADGEYVWVSDLVETGLFDETGWFSNLVKVVEDTVNSVVDPIVSAVVTMLEPAIRVSSNLAVNLLGEFASDIGAVVLDMGKDRYGVYHADFDCWQQYFGYIDLYDTVFDAATEMRSAKFRFDSDGDGLNDRILWAWKGDYLNLGAGAELGVYKKWAYGNEIWIVDKNLSMKMTLQLDYKNETIINWEPGYQWWITGFNPDYQNVRRDDLTATFTVRFKSYSDYNSFRNTWKYDDRWSFGSYYTATLIF